MRQICHCLHGFSKPVYAAFIERNRQEDRGGDGERHFPHTVKNRISDQFPEIVAVDKIRKILEPDPRAPCDPLQRLKITESDLRIPNGYVLEYDEINN